MEYKTKICSICGGNSLTEIFCQKEKENIFYTYKCNICGDVFSTSAYYRAQERAKVRMETIHKSKSSSAKDVFNKNIHNTIEVRAIFGDTIMCGTGILLGNGYVLTNKHVVIPIKKDNNIISLCDEYFGKGNGTEPMELEFVYADQSNDIALLRAEGLKSKVDICMNPVETGDQIFIIGNSKGYGICILDGIVSDCERTINGQKFIMISAPATHGNSGGPVFNDHGDLVGMVTMGQKDVLSMNYAISVADIIDFVKLVEDKEGIVINTK